MIVQIQTHTNLDIINLFNSETIIIARIAARKKYAVYIYILINNF